MKNSGRSSWRQTDLYRFGSIKSDGLDSPSRFFLAVLCGDAWRRANRGNLPKKGEYIFHSSKFQSHEFPVCLRPSLSGRAQSVVGLFRLSGEGNGPFPAIHVYKIEFIG